MTLGSTLRRLRKERGLTLERLGELAGLHGSTISRLEHDENPNVSAQTLSKLGRALGIDVRQFHQAAGWYSSPPEILAEEDAKLGPDEQKIIEIIRSAPTPSFRESLLQSITDLATIARNADADRHHWRALALTLEGSGDSGPEATER
jgi:transcriptional regulator with XRE-family HTH domain